MKKKLILLGTIFLVIALVSYAGIAILDSKDDKEDEKIVAATFTPIYVIVQNLLDDCDGVKCVNVTSNVSGCLHDYQLSSKDMRNLENADALVINGAGMESFIEDAVSVYPDLKIIDSSTGIELLEESEIHDEDEASSEESGHSHEEENAHIWLNTENYLVQIENVYNGLVNLYPQYEEQMEKNKDSYSKKVKEVQEEMKKLKNETKETDVIIFHDAFAYFAKEIGVEVAASVEIEDESSLSAGVIAEIIKEIKEKDIHVLLTEKQYSSTIADRIAAETDAKVYVFDSLVSSSEQGKNSYIDGMKRNIETLKNVDKEN